MKRTRKFAFVLALAAFTLSSLPPATWAQKRDLTPAVVLQNSSSNLPTQNAWWGAAAAAGCGLGIRYWPVAGWNLGYNALLVTVCSLALFDAIS